MRSFIHSMRSWCGLLLATLLLVGCSRPSHKETRDIGYKGLARTQPFLALQRTIEELGWQPSNIHSLSEMPRRGTLVLSGGSGIRSSVARQAMTWVEQGHGHLILLMDGTDSWQDDWNTDFFSLFTGVEGLKQHPVIRALNLIPSENRIDKLSKSAKPDPLEYKLHREDLKFSDFGGITFETKDLTQPADFMIGEPEKAAVVSVPWHTGRITVVGNATAFRNRFIDQEQNALTFVRLLQFESFPDSGISDTVAFMLSSSDGFFTMLWQQYWMALIALISVIIFWLWKNIPRFGPQQPVRDTSARQFSEHLLMSGNFFWRHGQTLDLLLPIRTAIQTKLQHRHGMHPHEDEANIIEHLARFSGLPSERVASAWNASYIKDGRALLTCIQDLQTIEQSI